MTSQSVPSQAKNQAKRAKKSLPAARAMPFLAGRLLQIVHFLYLCHVVIQETSSLITLLHNEADHRRHFQEDEE